MNLGTTEIRPQAASARPAHTAAVNDDALYSLVTRRLMPALLAAFCIAYLDRINVGLAKLQMASDLGFSDAVYGFGAGIFYLAYALLEVPSNLIMHRVGARRWIARIAVSWGLVSMCMLFVRTPASFYALRLLLGAAECGLFPGIILYLTYWYPAHRRGKSWRDARRNPAAERFRLFAIDHFAKFARPGSPEPPRLGHSPGLLPDFMIGQELERAH